MIQVFRICSFSLLSSAIHGFPALAKEPLLNQKIMEYLAGDPIVNEGSDGVLVQLPNESAEQLSAGSALYARHCASCHGDKLQGQPNWNTPGDTGLLPAPPHDKTGHTWHHADDQLFEIVKYGPAIAMGDPNYRSIMPAFDLSLHDDEIILILLFIRSTWPDEQREWQKGANDAQTGKEWWRKPSD